MNICRLQVRVSLKQYVTSESDPMLPESESSYDYSFQLTFFPTLIIMNQIFVKFE